jgi:predicted AlkP superfamily pyrophosphatase or phosphodiesterase
LLGYPEAAAESPRLVILVVIDQFKADYLTAFASHWRAGFRTLLQDGAVFRNARYPYAHTDTCAGHATIATGTLPYRHGMVGDDWWDRDAGEQVECTEDTASAAVSYGGRTRMFNSGRRMLVPTFADELRRQRREARVVTVSLKARSAIALAGHGGDAVTWFDENAGTFLTSKAFASAPVPAVMQFIASHPFEADLGTTWTLRDAPGGYRYRDSGIGERPPGGWNGLFPHVLSGRKAKTSDTQFRGQWRRSPAADAYVGRLAQSLLDGLRLGQRDATDFLGISFSAVDYVGHSFGPESRELEDAAARMDDVLGGLIAALDATVGRERYVLALTADHGVATIPSAAGGTGRVAAEDVRERIEDTLRGRAGALRGPGSVAAMVGGNVYLSPAARTKVSSDRLALRAVQDAVEAMPGIERLIVTADLTTSSSDPVERAAALGALGSRSGDFIAVPKRGWVMLARGSGNATTHGTPYDYDQRVPLILFGAGIRAGAHDGAVTPADIVPTLSALTGVGMSATDGRVLREALITN